RGIQSDFLGGESGSGRHARIHLKGNRRSADRVIDSVQDVDHALDLGNSVGHFRSPLLELLGVLGEELNLNWFRSRRQIADHVLKDLNKLDVKRRLLLLYIGAYVGNN